MYAKGPSLLASSALGVPQPLSSEAKLGPEPRVPPPPPLATSCRPHLCSSHPAHPTPCTLPPRRLVSSEAQYAQLDNEHCLKVHTEHFSYRLRLRTVYTAAPGSVHIAASTMVKAPITMSVNPI